MSSSRDSGEFETALAAVLPLLYILKTTTDGLMVSIFVLTSVILFELIYCVVKKYLLRSLRFALALVVLSTVLSVIWFSSPLFGFPKVQSDFFVCLISAFVLVYGSIRKEKFNLLKTWGSFLGLTLFTGLVVQNVRPSFLPVSFLAIGILMMICVYMRKKIFHEL